LRKGELQYGQTMKACIGRLAVNEDHKEQGIAGSFYMTHLPMLREF